MKAASTKYRWPWIAAFSLLILYAANWMFSPEIVGITKLEAFFRPRGEKQFNAGEWKRAAPSAGERYEMVDDLLGKKTLLGRSKEEVKELLGKPDIDTIVGGEPEMHYTLASQKTFPSKSALFPGRLENLELWTLLIRFQDGRVSEATIKVD